MSKVIPPCLDSTSASPHAEDENIHILYINHISKVKQHDLVVLPVFMLPFHTLLFSMNNELVTVLRTINYATLPLKTNVSIHHV